MTEYITKKQAQDILCRGCNKDLHLICRCDKWAEIRRTDGIDIVRCKECKYTNKQPFRIDSREKEVRNLFCGRMLKYVDMDWFCADGEREE